MECKESIKLTFDKTVRNEILDYLDKSIDSDGSIVEKSNPTQKVLTIEGEEILAEEFGGAKKGSEVFIKKDLISLIRFSQS